MPLGRAFGQRREQRRGVGVVRIVEERADLLLLDLLAGVLHLHTRSAVSATTPMSWVMRISAMPVSSCRLGQQLEDLRLDRHVERRRRLVGDQELGLAGDGHGDHHPLAHAARELVREGVEALFRRRDADHVHQLDRARPAGGLAVEVGVLLEASLIWKPTVKHGLSEDIGSWKIIDMSRPMMLAALLGASCSRRSLPSKARTSAVIVAVQGRRPITASIETDLPEPRFADDGQEVARSTVDVDPVDGAERAGGGGELDREVADFEKRHRLSSASAWGRARRAARRP